MASVRRVLKRCGIRLPFSAVICPEHVKSITIDPEWRVQITVCQKLVFLERPEAGDLHDTCAVARETALHDFHRQSFDSAETGRHKLAPDQIVVDWQPKGTVVPYALYDHEFNWSPSGARQEPAFSSEFVCEMKTGSFMLEFVAPGPFEAAVVFERPRWPMLNNEYRLMKYALKQLEAKSPYTAKIDQGRVESTILAPRLGTRYICVAFQFNGIAQWQERLRSASLIGRMRQLIGLQPT
jgi:hypothetical protein